MATGTGGADSVARVFCIPRAGSAKRIWRPAKKHQTFWAKTPYDSRQIIRCFCSLHTMLPAGAHYAAVALSNQWTKWTGSGRKWAKMDNLRRAEKWFLWREKNECQMLGLADGLRFSGNDK